MRTPTVEVGDIFCQHAPQMPPVQEQIVVQTFGSNRFHPSLRDGVGLRRSERRADRSDTESFQPQIKGHSVTTVTIVNEKARWRALPTTSLDDLSSGPFARRVTCGSHMHDFSTGVMNDEKDVDCPEQDCLDAEEIAGPDLAGMRSEKIAPVRRCRPSRNWKAWAVHFETLQQAGTYTGG